MNLVRMEDELVAFGRQNSRRSRYIDRILINFLSLSYKEKQLVTSIYHIYVSAYHIHLSTCLCLSYVPMYTYHHSLSAYYI